MHARVKCRVWGVRIAGGEEVRDDISTKKSRPNPDATPDLGPDIALSTL